jgi:hypothetical protein
MNRFWHGRNGTLFLDLYFSFFALVGDGVLILTTTIQYDVVATGLFCLLAYVLCFAKPGS